jgi:hypothetical protein
MKPLRLDKSGIAGKWGKWGKTFLPHFFDITSYPVIHVKSGARKTRKEVYTLKNLKE